MSPFGVFAGVKPYGQSGSSAYDAYLLEGVRERVEEEIAANDFVRGAWRETRGELPDGKQVTRKEEKLEHRHETEMRGEAG